MKNTKEKIKVWRFNEYDWVAGEDLDDAIEWYCCKTGMEKHDAIDETFFEECNLDETVYIDEATFQTYYKPKNVASYGRVQKYGKWFVKVRFNDVIQHEINDSPCIIATTEF